MVLVMPSMAGDKDVKNAYGGQRHDLVGGM
jgi:hypothetical protein